MIKRPILELSHVFFSYTDDSSPVVRDISFELPMGETLGVIGPNGGGKSTLLKIIAGLLRPKRGHLYIEGRLIESDLPFPYEKIGLVPQFSQLNSLMPITPLDLLQMQAQLRPSIDKNPQQLQNHLNEILKIVGLENKSNNKISQLSGGQRQRALLARALVGNPSLLLLDEPFTGLDSTGQDQLVSLLKLIKKEHNTTIILVDHNLTEVIKNCDRIICLNQKIHWHDQKELLTKSVLENVYHCEFEHLLVHETMGQAAVHIPCLDEDHHQHRHNDHSPIKKGSKND